MGKLIVVEGSSDGMGKSTQHALLKEKLIKEGYNVYHHHFPTYGEYQAVPVEKYLSGDLGKAGSVNPYLVNSLYAIDRTITWHRELKEKYNEGILLLDRYTTSSIIYQSTFFDDIEDKKKFIDYVVDYEYNKLGLPVPDLVLFLYSDFNLAMDLMKKRVGNAGVSNDIHERDIEFMKKVYDTAMYVANYLNWEKIKCDDPSSTHLYTSNEIHEKVYAITKKKL